MAFNAGDIVFEITGDVRGINDAMSVASRNIKRNFGDVSLFVGKAMVGMGAAITGSVLGIGYKALSAAEEVSTASNRMVAALGLPAEEAERFREMIREIYGKNFGESLTDVGQAIQEVALGLQRVGVTSNEGIVQATQNAIMLRDAFQLEVGESINAVSGLMQNFGISATEAFDFITFGMQNGMNASGDFLDSIGEYATQFAEGGASAADFFNAMQAGMQSGMLGTDKAADAFKEFRVRILDGSKTTASALAMIGLDVNKITEEINAGTLTVAEAWNLVIEKLGQTSNAAIQMQAGVGLIGTQFEDLGAKTVLAMTMGSDSMNAMAGSTGNLAGQYETLGNDIAGVRRRIDLAAESIGKALGPVLSQMLDRIAPVIDATTKWIEKNPELTASLVMIGGAVGVVLTAMGTLLIMLPGIVQGWALLKGALAVVTTALGAVAAAIGAPVWAVVAGAAAIVAAGMALWAYWDQIKAGLIAVWEAIKGAFFTIWGPIINTITWLADVGLGVLNKVGGYFGYGPVGVGAPQYAMAPQGAFSSANSAPGGGGVGGGGGITMNFNMTGVTNPAETSRQIADILRLELRSLGI